MFYIVERSIVIVKPKQAFLDWINNNLALSDETQLNLENIRLDCNAYLIPEINEIEDGINYLDDNFDGVFQLELASWSEEQNLWPQERTLQMFWEWFDIEISPTLIDLSNTQDEEQEEEEDNFDTNSEDDDIETFH